MSNTILIKGDPQKQEEKCAAIVTPGELLTFNASGLLIPHGTAGGNPNPTMVAMEQEIIGNGIDTDYASGDTVQYLIPKPGDVLYMFLADGENIDKGDPVESDGNGDLQEHTPQAVDEGGAATYTIYANAVLGYAEEDLDNSAGGARARIKVRIA